MPPAPEQFWKMVRKTRRCWIWTGAKNGSYGKFQKGAAHRYSYELIMGKIPKDRMLHHLCGNPLCVKPSHLLAVTAFQHPEYNSAYNWRARVMTSLISIGKAAQMLGVSRDTLINKANEGRVRVLRESSGRRLLTEAEVKRLVEYRKTHPNSWPEKNGP